MSMDTCKQCDALVDTDDEPECYWLEYEDGSEEQLDYCLCVRCREEITNCYGCATQRHSCKHDGVGQ